MDSNDHRSADIIRLVGAGNIRSLLSMFPDSQYPEGVPNDVLTECISAARSHGNLDALAFAAAKLGDVELAAEVLRAWQELTMPADVETKVVCSIHEKMGRLLLTLYLAGKPVLPPNLVIVP